MANFDFIDCPFVYQAVTTVADVGSWHSVSSSVPGNHTEQAIDIFGTAATLKGYQNWKVSVDGGAFSSVDVGGGFAQGDLFSGLADSWHRVVIKDLSNIFNTDTLVVTSDTTAAIRSALPWFGTSYRMLAAPVVAAVKAYGAFFEDETFDSLRTSAFWGNGLVFTTSGASTGLRLFGYNNAAETGFDVYVDGVYHSTVQVNCFWFSVDVVTGLTPGAHVIEMRKTDANRADLYFCCVSVIGGALNTSVTPTYGEQVAASGDSITQNSSSDSPSSSTAYVAVMASNLAVQPLNAGVGGALVPEDNNVPNAILRRGPSNVFVYYGTNNASVSGDSAAVFQGKYTAFLQKLIDGTSLHDGLAESDSIFVLMPFPWLATNFPDYVQATTDAVGDLSLPAGSPTVTLVPTTGTPTFTGITDTHPSNEQQAEIAAYLETFLSPSSTVTSVSIAPTTATRYGGQTQQFVATVLGEGDFDDAVTWTASAGSISGGGLFTAPYEPQTVTITATSVQDETKFGTASVTIIVAAATSHRRIRRGLITISSAIGITTF